MDGVGVASIAAGITRSVRSYSRSKFTRRAAVTRPEQILQRHFAVVPVPHRPRLAGSALDAGLRGPDGSALGDELIHPLDQVWEVPSNADHAAPGVGAGPSHPPSQVRLKADRNEGGFVPPVLEELAPYRPGRMRRQPVQNLAGIGAQSGE